MPLTYSAEDGSTSVRVYDGDALLGWIVPSREGGRRFDGCVGVKPIDAASMRAIADRIDALDAAKAR